MNKVQEKTEWNERAKEDPYFWTVTSNRNWNAEEYYKTGKEDFDEYVAPVIAGMDTSHMRALDIGCGTGRITRYFKGRFSSVIGVDISEEMINKAKEDNPGIEFAATNGRDLNGIPAESVDFIHSFAVLQSITSRNDVAHVVEEMYRVLKKGGKAHFDVRTLPGGAPGKIIAWKAFDRSYAALMLWHRFIPLPYVRRYDSLYGACFTDTELRTMVECAGFIALDTMQKGKRRWITCVKK
jgi:ubiquinone/menaquinone biosynthesis C-methylase UbiE